MTFTAKVLVLIILVLSLIFATMAGVLYNKRMKYQQALADVKSTLVVKIGELGQEVKKRDGQISKLRDDYAKLQFADEKVKMELAKTKELGQKSDEIIKDLREDNIQVKADKDAMQTLLKTAEQRRDLVEKELATRRKELEKTSEKLFKAQTDISNLNRNLAKVEDQRDKLGEANRGLSERLEMRENQIALLRKRFGYDAAVQNTLDSEFTTLKDIQGKVLKVDPGTGYVIINRGRADDVLKDYVFTVYRDDNYVARIRISELDPEGKLSAGKIINQKLPVKRGDTVATRLIP